MHALLFSLLLSAPAAQPEALVLGIRGSSGLATFVVSDAGIERIGSGLAVPRKDGWWKLDEKRLEKGDSHRDVLVASKKAPAAAPAFDLDEGCEEQTSIDLLFVSGDWISFESGSGGYCEGAAHPYASDSLLTIPFDQAQAPAPAKIGTVIDAPAEKALLAQGAKLQKKLADDCVADPDASSWGLVRSKGRWTLRGQLGYAYEACRGTHHEFDVGVPAPAKLTGPDALPAAWESYKEPGLTDVIASPSGAIVLEVTKSGFSATSGGRPLGQVSMRFPAVVMAQWAVGQANVDRWKQDAPKALR